MRDGEVIRTDAIAGETKQSLVDSMLGKASEIIWPQLPPAPADSVPPIAEMREVATTSGLSNISLTIRPGEIVGLIGLVGAGRTEVGRALFGAERLLWGTYVLDGDVQKNLTIHQAVKKGVALVPEDRRKEGLVLSQTTRPNVSLASLDQISRLGIVNRRRERDRVARMIDHFGIIPARSTEKSHSIPAGNQQKVLLSKWAVERPKLLILDEPSRGVDIGARQRIHEFIVEMAAAGVGVLLISSELEEVINLSHRGYLMSEGRIFAQADCRELTVQDALKHIFRQQGQETPKRGNRRMSETHLPTSKRHSVNWIAVGDFARQYGVLIIIGALLIGLSFASENFLTARNLLNILNQSAPLAIIACALTLVIIGGGFDLSTGAIFGVASVSAGWLAINVDPYLPSSLDRSSG